MKDKQLWLGVWFWLLGALFIQAIVFQNIFTGRKTWWSAFTEESSDRRRGEESTAASPAQRNKDDGKDLHLEFFDTNLQTQVAIASVPCKCLFYVQLKN